MAHAHVAAYRFALGGRVDEWEKKLDDTVNELKRASDNHLKNKEHFKGYEKELSNEQIQQKIKDYEKVLQNIAEDERRKEHNKKMIIPKIILYYAVAMLLLYLLKMIADF